MAAVVGRNMGQEHTRACMVCQSWFVTEIKADGTYTEGYYFGSVPFNLNEPDLTPNQHPDEIEIWECNACHDEIAQEFEDGTAAG